jgi:hypothetical protein
MISSCEGVLKTELSRVLLRGYVASVSNDVVELESESRDIPFFRVTLVFAGVSSVEEKGFDISVLEEFGDLFDDLEPERRGKLWAERFELAWVVRFVSGATCVVEKIPG